MDSLLMWHWDDHSWIIIRRWNKPVVSYDRLFPNHSISGLCSLTLTVFCILFGWDWGHFLHNDGCLNSIQFIKTFFQFSHLKQDSLNLKVHLLLLELWLSFFGNTCTVGSALFILVHNGKSFLSCVTFLFFQLHHFSRRVMSWLICCRLKVWPTVRQRVKVWTIN